MIVRSMSAHAIITPRRENKAIVHTACDVPGHKPRRKRVKPARRTIFCGDCGCENDPWRKKCLVCEAPLNNVENKAR